MLSIHPATYEDIAPLSTFAALMFAQNFGHLYEPHNLAAHLERTCSPEFFRREMEEGAPILVAHEDAELAGYIKYGPVGLPIECQESDREIHRLYVHPDRQGKRVGQLLMEAALQDLVEAPAIYLGVWEYNLTAQRFYAHYGFVEVGEYRYWVGTDSDRELILRRG